MEKIKKRDRILIFSFLFLGLSCSKKIVFDTSLRSFQVSSIKDVYSADCKISFKLKKKKNSGNCKLVFDSNQFLLTIYDPIGRDILEIYLSKKNVTYVNYYEKEYQFLSSTKSNLEEILGLNFLLPELQAVFWGRKIDKIERLQYIYKNEVPAMIIKGTGDKETKVSYMKWTTKGGIPLPKKIRITRPKTQLKIIYVMSEFIEETNPIQLKPKIPKNFSLKI